MHGSSGCVGSSLKPKLVSAVEEPLKQQNMQVQISPTGNKGIIFERFWTAGNCDIDIGTFQSQGSISSLGTSMHDPHGTGSSNVSTEFVNHGLLNWNQSRKQWIGNRKPNSQVQRLREPKLSTLCLCIAKKFWLCSWNATYDSLLGSNKPFSKPIPLAEMVDFLVDTWEEQGMYD